MFFSPQIFALLLCAIAYYKAAEFENESGILWAGMSAAVFYITWRLLRWYIPGDLLGQLLLLAGIAIYRAFRDSNESS